MKPSHVAIQVKDFGQYTSVCFPVQGGCTLDKTLINGYLSMLFCSTFLQSCFLFFSTQIKTDALLFFLLYIIFELGHSQEWNYQFVYIARMASVLSFRRTRNIRISQTTGNESWPMSDNIP